MKATYKGDKKCPSENQLQTILKSLKGKDPETKAELAFSTITMKLEGSESRKLWYYLIKNLIILDRCVEDKTFLK